MNHISDQKKEDKENDKKHIQNDKSMSIATIKILEELNNASRIQGPLGPSGPL